MRRFASLFLCLTAVVAMMAMTVAPALADEENRGQEKKEEATENHQQADQEASSSKSEESSQKRESAPGREKKSSGSSTSSSGDDGSSQSQGPKPYPTTGDEDPEGKRYDGEGEPRGETAATCTNDDEGNFSGNGANRSGPYDSTCDGSASLAGNGGGSATGRPCAGCVGSADYKNPRGQYPDGNHDGNAGYECDANNGVGRSNPAHTGCRPATTTVPPPPPPPVCPTNPTLPLNHPGCAEVLGRTDKVNPPKVCPSGPYAGVAAPNMEDCELPPRVLPNVIRRLATPLANVARRAGAVLPFTGAGDLYFATGLSILLIALGAVALRIRREEA